MKWKLRLMLFAFAVMPFVGSAQDTLINKLDSLNRKTDSAGGQINNTSPELYQAVRLKPLTYITLLASDLKQEFTKPFHMRRKDWTNFGKFILVGSTLALADKPVQQYSYKLVQRNPDINKFSGFITKFGGPYETLTLGAFGAYGIIFKNQKMKTTTLLATQAYITGAALESVLKYITGRTRPSFYGLNEIAQPKFLGPFSKPAINANGTNSYSSFPSGHTTVAFSAATVFALEYSNKPWVPILAYTSATLIGLSRITENRHWVTDVFAGAAVGYLAGRNVVNNYHRYAKIRGKEKKKKPLSFNLQYNHRHVEPGVIYKL